MCGIIGYLGEEDALPIISKGLKNLEYRGYDSAGIALQNSEMTVFKRAGEIDDLKKDLPESSDSTSGIGHTRWSTHGEPTDENAHPHVDCNGSVAVVHNGIIENYDELKQELKERGHKFTSETDTEVVPHLVEEKIEKNDGLRKAVSEAVSMLEGSFAVCVTAEGYDSIICARVDSPLVVGVGEDSNFVASDVTAFLEHTRDVIYLEDGDLAEVKRESVDVYDFEGTKQERDTETVDWDAEAAEKGGYEHYMLKEIHEQPHSLRQTLSGRIDEVEGKTQLDISLPEEYLKSLEEIQIVAMGTSYHAGLYARKLLEKHADVRVTVEQASEYEFTGGRDPWRTLVVAITQSGETSDTLSAVREAKRNGARTLAVTNTVGSTVTREADDVIYIRAGPEIGVAATKTFASQVATLGLFTVHVARIRDSLSSRKASEILENIRRLPGAVQQVLDNEDRVKDVAKEYKDGKSFFFIGRALGHPVALEGALKLKEISYDHAEGFSSGELKHGPLALVTPETPVLALLTDGTRPEESLNNAKEVESRSAPVIGVSSESFEEADKYVDENLTVPDLGEMEPLVANVHFQLFAYHIANFKDRAIDKPRNLAKSVTVK